MKKQLGVIIPVYNEAANIVKTLIAIDEYIKTPHRIYLVYDFDDDNTIPVTQDYVKKTSADLFLLKNKSTGVLNAIKTGLLAADEESLLVTMADMSDDYTVVDEMHRLICEGFDLVCGSRYMARGKQIGGPFVKKTLSRLAGVSLKYLANIPTHDATNSFKMYRRNMIGCLEIESGGGFEIGMEMVVKAHFTGYKITELPCVWRDRTGGTSRFKLIKWMPKYLKWYSYAIRNNLLKRHQINRE